MLPATSNPQPTHTHYFIFNDDGFEVCNKCGICTTLRHLEPGLIIQEPANNYRSEFSDVLINNHIGYVDAVENEYRKIKLKLLRGYPNVSLYAYCTYFVLLQNNIYYSIKHISEIFKIPYFTKHFCQIENKMCGQSKHFDIANNRYIFSSLNLYLAQHGQGHYLEECKKAVLKVKMSPISSKPNFVACMSIFLTLKDFPDPLLIPHLSEYYSVNIRTLKSYIKRLNRELVKVV